MLQALRLNEDARIVTFFLGYASCFVLLSVNAEGIFYSLLFVLFKTWVEVEHSLRQHHTPNQGKSGVVSRALSHGDVRAAVFFFFFVHGIYFGMGK